MEKKLSKNGKYSKVEKLMELPVLVMWKNKKERREYPLRIYR